MHREDAARHWRVMFHEWNRREFLAAQETDSFRCWLLSRRYRKVRDDARSAGRS